MRRATEDRQLEWCGKDAWSIYVTGLLCWNWNWNRSEKVGGAGIICDQRLAVKGKAGG
jgi:hypothetical protein